MKLSLKKCHHLVLLSLLFATTGWAEFSPNGYLIHPWYLGVNEPFIVELVGEWPNDCHPGEQKPVITDYTGNTALVEFETIVVRDTCNDVPTPYRVLIDMSDVVGSLEGDYLLVDITVRFAGEQMLVEAPHPCAHLCSPAPLPRDIKPEAGLYHGDDLDKQGLLLARQDQRMAAYPLIYDESGSSEWVFAGGGIKENVFFADLYELTGGQCLGCPAPEDTTQMNVVGKISMLTDSEGVVQVKVNDGLFVPYEQTEFGYGSRDVGGHPNRRIPDFSGRWAFINDSPMAAGEPVPSGDPSLAYVYDIQLESVEVNLPPIVPETPPMEAGNAVFSLRSKLGEKMPDMTCTYVPEVKDLDGEVYYDYFDAQLECDIFDLEEPTNRIYVVKASSLDRLTFHWTGPITSTPEPLVAVRID